MMFAANSFGQSAGLRGQPLSAMYFLHIGESNKPLWPFVLCLKEPESAEVAEILEEPLRRYVEIFIVPENDIEAIEKIIQNSLTESKKSVETTRHSYGSFQVTMVGHRSKNSVLLNPDQSILIFRAIFKQTSPSQKKLRFYLSNLLQRLGIDSPVDSR
jgi:hypothetical protein